MCSVQVFTVGREGQRKLLDARKRHLEFDFEANMDELGLLHSMRSAFLADLYSS